MSERRTLLRPAADAGGAVEDVARACGPDGQSPFSDQTRVDARSGQAEVLEVLDDAGGRVGVAAVTREDGADSVEFAVVPSARGIGHGGAVLSLLLGRIDGPALFWAHGDHPAAGALAAREGLERVRVLRQLRMPLDGERPPVPCREDLSVASFDAGADADDWVALNARVFASHPEQGRMTAADLEAREAEPWFDACDFLVARDASGRMVAYVWLKVEDGVGEVYVLGVDEAVAGRGVGRFLMERGLRRLRERGCRIAALYVDDDNPRAVGLYRSMGFRDHAVDVRYRH